MSREAFAERAFTPSEVVEMILTAAFYQMVGRVVRGLAVEAEPEYREALRDLPWDPWGGDPGCKGGEPNVALFEEP